MYYTHSIFISQTDSHLQLIAGIAGVLGTSSSRTSRARLVPKTAGGKRPHHQDASCESMVMKWTVAKTPMVWFRRFKGRVSIKKSMNGSFSIWDELKISESSIWFAWGSCPEHIFHLGACVFQRNCMAHLEMIARFLGSVMMFPNLGKRRTRQLKFLFCWPRRWQRARCFWGFCTAKASGTVNQNISPIFVGIFWSLVGPFSWIHSPRNWRPKKTDQVHSPKLFPDFFH